MEDVSVTISCLSVSWSHVASYILLPLLFVITIVTTMMKRESTKNTLFLREKKLMYPHLYTLGDDDFFVRSRLISPRRRQDVVQHANSQKICDVITRDLAFAAGLTNRGPTRNPPPPRTETQHHINHNAPLAQRLSSS